MSIAVQPRRFITGRMLDAEDFNQNFLAAARDVNENLSRRYTYSTVVVPMTGMADTDGAGVRSFEIQPNEAGGSMEVIGMDMRVCATAGVTWTVAFTAYPTNLSVATTGATTEALASSSQHASITVPATLTGVFSASGASTIAAGELVIYLRTDRGGQGDSHEGYEPFLYELSSGVLASALDAELVRLQDAVENDTDNDIDLRCEMYLVRGLASGGTIAFQCPSGVRRLQAVQYFVAADAARTVRFTIGGSVTVATVDLAGSGVGTLQGSVDNPSAQSIPDDPTDTADDTVVTLTELTSTGTVAMAYALLWWS